MNRVENNIVYDAYYLIKKFNDNAVDVSNLQIQKLMYFFESYYMNIYKTEKLYDCNFSAWSFGPVSIPLYKEFKKFGNGKIELTQDNIKNGEEISQEKKELLDNIYEAFKSVTPMKLVEFTHMQSSPWREVWENNGKTIVYGDKSYIDKLKSKEWFKKTFERNK